MRGASQYYSYYYYYYYYYFYGYDYHCRLGWYDYLGRTTRRYTQVIRAGVRGGVAALCIVHVYIDAYQSTENQTNQDLYDNCPCKHHHDIII